MRPLLLALVCAAALSACAGAAEVTIAEPSYPSWPTYVYADNGGGCWADDVWYARCRWATPGLGLYWWTDGRFQPRPGYVWRDHRAPPPRHWHNYRPAPRPPVRDHRR